MTTAACKDTSPRTRQIKRYYIMLIVALLFVCIGLPWNIAGHVMYARAVAHSSTPIGTELTFTRSTAKVTLAGIYTDRQRSAMIIRLAVPKESSLKLPAYGSKYRVFISSKQLASNVKKMDVIFGRMSTDGDMFLVIPKPNTGVYSIFVMNTVLLRSQLQDSTASTATDDTSRSVADAIKQYTFNPNTTGNVYTIKSNSKDMINFRATLDPAKHDARYQPTVLNTTLVDPSTHELNYSGMYNTLFKQNLLKATQNQYDTLQAQIKQLHTSLTEYHARLDDDPTNTQVSAAAASVVDQLQLANRKQQQLAEYLNRYENISSDAIQIKHAQTTANVVHVR